MSDPKIPLYPSPGDAGKAVGWSRTKIMDLVRAGKLEAVVDGRRIRIVGRSLEALLASLPAYKPGQMPDLHPRNPLPAKTKHTRRSPGSRAGKKSSNLKVAQNEKATGV